MNKTWDRLPACRAQPDRLEAYPTTIIGVGSPHGDDQFGWVVAEELENTHGLVGRKISNPIDLIGWLDESDRVIVIDAAVGLPGDVDFQMLGFANAKDRTTIGQIRSHGTHDIGLEQTLRMAESLGKRTDHVELWVGNARNIERLDPMSPALIAIAKCCAAEIFREVCDARTIAG
ncbi:hypothetical protein Poly51_38650 [Rubripirellula tenax]|uniref:Hydrogenase maturation protease n=1 Tax=Rubripirellula tenax TaxID=2528015 RepID=A0A5C6ELH9_9BACT|nr:hypothetical protein [Rubripirellula tenax]TWU50573.1 hypothetical protein Poly51_38650 [Rubripirellula tenax]